MTAPILYEARGNVVHKLPVKVRNETDTGDTFEVGFPVCTASEYVDADTIAAILNEHEAIVSDEDESLSDDSGCANVVIWGAFALLTVAMISLASCASYQPPGEDLWLAVPQERPQQ